MSTKLTEKVKKILEKADFPDRHTYFQIQKFMIGKEPTAQAQLWAIVRELQARSETLDNYEKDLKDAEDNIELFDLRIERLNRRIKKLSQQKGTYTDLNISECEINIRKLQRDRELLIKSAQKANKRRKSVEEEMVFLADGYDKIVSQHGEMKPIDDEQAQKEMWNERLLEDFNLRIIFQRPLDPEFVRTVMCLSDDAPVKAQVTTLIENIQKKMYAERKALSASSRPSIEVKPQAVGK